MFVSGSGALGAGSLRQRQLCADRIGGPDSGPPGDLGVLDMRPLSGSRVAVGRAPGAGAERSVVRELEILVFDMRPPPGRPDAVGRAAAVTVRGPPPRLTPTSAGSR